MWRSILVTFTFAATACTSAAGQGSPAAPAPMEVAMYATLSSVTEAVLSDAAERTGLAKASLAVESAEAVTWADGSLGCPQPGMNYTMALVPGYRIKVRAGEQLLDYHASQRGHFVLCRAPRAEEPVNSVRD